MTQNATDTRILQILLNDARTSLAQIAEEIGLSRPAISERLKKLEQAGVIAGYTAVLAPEKIDQSLTAFISAKHQDILSDEVRQALQALSNSSEVIEIHSIAGDDCFLIKVRTSGVETLNAIVNRLKEPPFRMATKTTIVLERYFEKTGGITLDG